MGVIFSASALHQRPISISCTSNTRKADSQHSTQFCITLQATTLRLFTCRPAPLLPRRRTPSWAAVSDEHRLRWRPRVPPRDGGMFEADLNMEVLNAEHAIAKRNVGLTLADLVAMQLLCSTVQYSIVNTAPYSTVHSQYSAVTVHRSTVSGMQCSIANTARASDDP